jgi:hypothetical protein
VAATKATSTETTIGRTTRSALPRFTGRPGPVRISGPAPDSGVCGVVAEVWRLIGYAVRRPGGGA